ncbi:mucin-16-like [Rhineura floridana]|uniref:mucin-16-like n=1 Tax=Rhineura floridana TaxID=261503 RepID=UPI002AC83CF6|nr:mucin-16-like [Rhineura floridana]
MPTQTPTPIPEVEHFTVNFTLTNLKYKPEMGTPGSRLFNATEKDLMRLLDKILLKSSIGSAYLECKVTQLRPVRNGDETGMDAICTYRNDSSTPVFDRVKVYHEIVNQTYGFTKMGQYYLERYSLYVNGYNEAPLEATTLPTPTQTPTPIPEVEHFTVNFTLTNLKYKPEMGTPGSRLFNATEKDLMRLLDKILLKSSIGSAYLECKVTQLRPVRNGDETGMDAICTYRNDSSTPVFDRVKVYHEIVNQTYGFTKMGQYYLERYSLYVNGYNEAPLEATTLPTPTQTPTPIPAVEHFTINFTITNLKYKPEMGTPNTMAFNATERVLTTLLGKILHNSSIGPTYSGCKVTQLSPVRDGDGTAMDAICTYHNDSTMPVFDRVKVYHEIVNQTDCFTKIGPYHLERYSLYVNGYNEVPLQTTTLSTPTQTPTPIPALEHFTVNFTVTNLKYKPEMGTPHSKAFNATEKALTTLLGRILAISSIGPAYLGCKVTTLRLVKNGDETGMDAICTYQNDSTMPVFDRVKVYHEIVDQTNGFTKMGPYALERYSLYVNGYNEVPLEPTVLPTTTQMPTPAVEHFTVNFTVTNLKFKPEMATPHSKAFNATEKALTTLLGRILSNSSMGPAYLGCNVTTLRLVKNGDETGMDAICTYQNDSTMPVFDRVKVYHEIVDQTNGFTKMGPYALERYSLYVNGSQLGYNEVPLEPTVLPTTTQMPTPAVEHFTVNFTVTNLKFKPEMATPHSKAFNATEKALTTLLGRILSSSSMGPAYLECNVTTLRLVKNGDETGMDAICTYRNDSTMPVFDRVKVYHDIVDQTNGFTKMGPYALERYSLYVNGYNEVPLEPTVLPTTTQMPTPAVEHFTVNFTVTNLKFKPEMATPHSKAFNATEKALTTLLGRILSSSSMGPAYLGCNVTTLRLVKNGDETGMDAICTYRNDSTMPVFDRVKVYHDIVDQTNGFTKMGPYALERYSLYVNGYNEVPLEPTVLPTTTQMPTPAVEHFTVNFTVTNLKFKPEMATPHSKAFNATEKALTTLLGRILSSSSMGPAYLGCNVTTLRLVKNGDETGMDAICTYRNDSTMPVFDRVKVYHEIVDQTNGFTKMGPYALERYSLYVNGYNEVPLEPRFCSDSLSPSRLVKNGDETGMDAICTYRNDSTMPVFDRVKVYHDIVDQTNGFTKMGPYALERYSLYVNGYNEVPLEPTVLPTTTQMPTPAVEHFTVNFTVTNLKFKPEMATPHSKAFNATEKALTTLLGRILSNSSMGPAYLGCNVTTLRLVKNGDETGMDAICTYRNDSTMPVFDRVKVYHDIVDQTNGFTKMGPYALERYSLYVNGYNEVPLEPTVLPTTTQMPTPAVEHFTVNFTVTNLKFKPEMATPHSKAFNATEKALTTLLGRILSNSSMGPAYLGCNVTTLRLVKNGDETGMDAICTYRNDSTMPVFDRVKVYHDIVDQTNGFTKMGPYALERYSLYVNGYNEVPLEPTVLPTTTQMPTPAVEHFTVNFTVTNLKFKPEMATPHSKAFNATEKALTTLLGRILSNSSMGPAYLGCNVTTLRLVKNGDETGMDAICTYRNDSTMPVFDRVKVYHDIVDQTNGFTKMGPYALERYSLYVNGYNEVPLEPTVLPTTTQMPTPAVEHFTVNFTVTNLKFKPEMATPHSKAFNATEKALTTLLGRILSNSSMGPAYLGCNVTTLRLVKNGDETGMDAICTYRNNSTMPIFDRVKVYHEIVDQTNGFTKMGPYALERYSLYVNAVLPTTVPVVEHFTVNFTVTNLKYKPELGTPYSKAFNATEKALTTLLGRILTSSSIGPMYLGCKVSALRPVLSGDETGMDAVCSYQNNSATPAFDRVKVYHEIVNGTTSFTKMGPYSLERYSLYINGYNEAPLEPTTQPPAPAEEHFTVNFTITNLKYKPEMGIPNSKSFNATEKALTTLLGRVLSSSSFGPDYQGCKVTALRPVRGGDETGMDAVCTYRSDSPSSFFDRVKVYHEIVNRTSSFTKMGPYLLDQSSLYVNDYNEVPPVTTVLPTTMPVVEHFTVNFTVTNLKYKPELGTPNSKAFNATEKALTTLLGRILAATSVGPVYLRCKVSSLRPMRSGDATGMDAICAYQSNSIKGPFDRVKVYHEIVNKTNGFTKMGPYSLDQDSLCVNDYNEAYRPIRALPNSTPPPTVVDRFTVNYTLTSLVYKPEMGIPKSKVFSATERALTMLKHGGELSKKGAELGERGLETVDRQAVTKKAGRSVEDGKYTGVDSVCSFQRDSTAPPFDQVQVYRELVNRTESFTKMGPYNLDQNSLFVNGYHELPHQLGLVTTPSPKPASEQFTANFTVTNLRYKPEMTDPHSKTFLSTEKVLSTLLGQILEKSSIGPAHAGCNLIALSSLDDGMSTAVDMICTYRKDAAAPLFDRVKVYHELINTTNGFANIGPYKLDKNSLYVNGYNELQSVLPLTSATPAKPPSLGHFTVNYTLSSLPYTSDMGVPGSRKFNSTVKALKYYMEPLLRSTSIGSAFTGCQVQRFRWYSEVDCC